MGVMNKGKGETIVVLGVFSLVGSITWAFFYEASLDGIDELKRFEDVPDSIVEEELMIEASLEEEPTHWEIPKSQSGGADWIFEVFTPPLIYYHPTEARFTVTPPTAARWTLGQLIDVLSIEHPLYRLQYRGYSRGNSGDLIEIEDIEAGIWYRGRIGDDFEESGFSINGFVVERVLVFSEEVEETPYVDYSVELSIWDKRIGGSILLRNEPHYVAEYAAQLKWGEGIIQTVTVGSVVEVEAVAFEIIEISEKEVVLGKVDGSIKGETRFDEPIRLSLWKSENEK